MEGALVAFAARLPGQLVGERAAAGVGVQVGEPPGGQAHRAVGLHRGPDIGTLGARVARRGEVVVDDSGRRRCASGSPPVRAAQVAARPAHEPVAIELVGAHVGEQTHLIGGRTDQQVDLGGVAAASNASVGVRSSTSPSTTGWNGIEPTCNISGTAAAIWASSRRSTGIVAQFVDVARAELIEEQAGDAGSDLGVVGEVDARALGDGATHAITEERRGEQVDQRAGARRLTEGRHPGRIAAEARPALSCTHWSASSWSRRPGLVTRAGVEAADRAQVEEAEHPDPVVERHDHDVLLGGQTRTVVGGRRCAAHLERAAVDPHQDRARVAVGGRTPHVQAEAVLVARRRRLESGHDAGEHPVAGLHRGRAERCGGRERPPTGWR